MQTQKHPSFPERITLLRRTAEELNELSRERQLRDFSSELGAAADTVMDEVLHMEAAQTRFANRKASRPTQRATH